jgi:hypothetical protein
MEDLAEELIDRDKWFDFLRRFVDVLRINIFMVDSEGRILVPPYRNGERKYGSEFLSTSFGFDFSGKKSAFWQKFQKTGPYLEAKDAFDFRVFAIPIIVDKNQQPVAHVIVGPVILNRRLDSEEYVKIASGIGLKNDQLVDVINEVRVVSFIAIKGILDLLSEVFKDVLELNLEKKRLHETRFNREILPKEVADVAQEMYMDIHLDELLVTILDVALNLTKAECGSIMILDEKSGELTIKVSRGLQEGEVKKARIKLGEGISGLSAQENQAFVISKEKIDNRIKHLLKRPEIKEAVIMPLSAKNRVFGVLNIHTKNAATHIETGLENLQHISRLISTAIRSI